MEYYGNTLCISARELVDGGIMTQSNYCQLVTRKKVTVARRGGGANRYALVAVSSLPDTYREKVNALYPDPSLEVLLAWLGANYEIDQAAVTYFNDWKVKCGHDGAKDEHVAEYVANASVLNACIRLYNNAKAIHKTMGLKYDWSMMAQAVEGYRIKTGHTLPTSMLRFRKKVNEYKAEGYACLISGKFGNQSRRKVDYKTERLILSIAIQPNKPFNTSVWEMYNSFVCGELDVFDYETGELLNPEDWIDKNGDPLSLSESTITNYLNMPKNRVLIDQKLMSYSTFMHEQMPHVHRHAPEFSFSKISFDDRDLPRKLADTKIRPKAYYAYDVASQCVVGYAYNRYKNVDLVTDCFRSMFRLIERKGWGCPAQIEVENHLMSQWRDSFLQAGVLFSFVRFCAPMNSQEKYAEPLNGAKKRSVEHKNHLGIGRFYAKNRAYRTESKKVFDALNDTYEDKQYYTWEELIADDMRDIQEFNNSLHPNQKMYPGMTRWQVLEANTVSAINGFYGNKWLVESDSTENANGVMTVNENSESLSDKIATLSAMTSVSNEVSAAVITDATVANVTTLNNETLLQTERVHYSLSATQMETVFPELVYSENGKNKYINYAELIPILVQSIAELKAEIAVLKGSSSVSTMNKSRSVNTNIQNEDIFSVISLSQNNPNPWSTNTDITVDIPDNVNVATMYFYDLKGAQVHAIDISQRGVYTVTLSSTDFTPGIYIYTLVTDGVSNGAKRMILTE